MFKCVKRIFLICFEYLMKIYGSDEIKNSSEILLVICGEVFDVSSGVNFYHPGKCYECLIRKDASRGYALGSLEEKNLCESIEDIDEKYLPDLRGYLNFFNNHKTYTHKGICEGIFYNLHGEKTELYLTFLENTN